MKNIIISAVGCMLAAASLAGEMNLPDGYEVVSSEKASVVIANASTSGLMSYNRFSAEGKKFKGILKSVEGRSFIVSVKEKVKVEGKKRPELQDVDHVFDMDEVKYTKYSISFK